MNEILLNLLLILSVAMTSAAIAYAWWIKIRVVRLRQDIYDKSNELSLQATELEALHDPAYIEAQKHLLSVAAIAEEISVPMVFKLAGRVPDVPRLQSQSPEAEQLVEETYLWVAQRTIRYLFQETLCGGVVVIVVNAVSRALKIPLDTKPVEAFVRSEVPTEMSLLKAQALPNSL